MCAALLPTSANPNAANRYTKDQQYGRGQTPKQRNADAAQQANLKESLFVQLNVVSPVQRLDKFCSRYCLAHIIRERERRNAKTAAIPRFVPSTIHCY
jgi:hypothetical protein